MVDNIASNIKWVIMVFHYGFDPIDGPFIIWNTNGNQDVISQSVIRSIQISSDRTIVNASPFEYRAQESISLRPSLTINASGNFEAIIDNCES